MIGVEAGVWRTRTYLNGLSALVPPKALGVVDKTGALGSFWMRRLPLRRAADLDPSRSASEVHSNSGRQK
jgi:hypothetical protein